MMTRRVGHWLALLLVFFVASCGGKKAITFSSAEPGSTISAVPLDNVEGQGQALSNPANVEVGKMQGKAIKIAAPGKSPQFWFPPEDGSRSVTVKVKQLQACAANKEEANRNRPLRLILKAYQSLTAQDYNLAIQLSVKATEIDPTLSAPHIIIGLTYLQQGKKEDARVAFNKAKALDPEDQEIGQLVRMVQ